LAAAPVRITFGIRDAPDLLVNADDLSGHLDEPLLLPVD
jgi:hypothetical protein